MSVSRYAPAIPAPAQDWLVRVVVDLGPGVYYRYLVRGENLNRPPDDIDRHFTWQVPALGPRYDLSVAVWDVPTGKLVSLSTGARFRHVGYPETELWCVHLGGGRYLYENEIAEKYPRTPYEAPDLLVVAR